ncbi:MAG: hypothetical protein FWH27_04490, partial [Planctomycetaceae bacterium]|nr:hypothetical protein [Planctomycetaceae bacterium]
TFEKPSGSGFADYLLPKTIAIEMKSKGKNLDDAYQQLLEYVVSLPDNEIPDLLMVSDFERIVLYHRTAKTKKQRKPLEFRTRDLCDYVDHFHALAGVERHYEIDEQFEVNVRAAEKMANLHDDLERLGYEGHVLEIYLVRLLFCLFSEDTGIFPQDSFLSYVINSKEDGSDLSSRIVRLFDVLDMPDEMRARRTQLPPDLREFRYIDGGLFKDPLPPADFDARMRLTLIDCCKFDWSAISPAIFGAMFQGVMNRDLRREIGAHYTGEDNILKLINPLFMDDLRSELARVKNDKRRLDDFHEKIARLKFLDPACGCGNFLMIAYRELRLLEIEVVRIKKSRMKKAQQKVLDISLLLKVNVEQFYGLEILDFPCEVARTGMWLIDHLMNRLASKELGQYFIRLPLSQSATIVHGNALRIDWENIVAKEELSYILGNPPYVGASMMIPRQKAEAVEIFGKIKLSNSIDYVGAWYHRAAAYIQDTPIRVAFLSTNSITQGEQVAPLWGKLFNEYRVHIDFAYRTFKWSNEAKGKAAVHCVIIGFSTHQHNSPKTVYDSDGTKIAATNINAYLVDAPNVLIASRSRPLCEVPIMFLGNKPTDGGHLLLTPDEKDALLIKEPQAEKLIRRYIGADEFINGNERFCFWLKDIPFSDVKKCPSLLARLEQVRAFRLASTAKPTVEKAETPHLFFFISHPETDYLLIPSTSSEKRKYIPIGYMDKDTISGNANMIIPDATLYHFGVLTSSVHMAWMRAVCGRLELRYRYSGAVVYNNFPWPEVSDSQITEIEKLAQDVLNARASYPDSTLADMYGENSMPFHPKLVKAHQALDRAVMKLYGFGKDATEAGIAAKLMVRYQELTGG